MRIISGTAGGITIKVPSLVTRPTTDQVREAVFSMLGEALVGARVLDLFAGSGAYGLEALSRGCTDVTFVEQNAKACAIIQDNLDRARLRGGHVTRSEAMVGLRRLAAQGQTFQLIFADPPYAKAPGDVDYPAQLLANDDLRKVLNPGGWLVLESMVTKRADAAMPHWTLTRDRSYGSTRVLLLQLSQSPSDADPSGAPGLQPVLSIPVVGTGSEGAAQNAAARGTVE